MKPLRFAGPGYHTLKICVVDPAVVLQKARGRLPEATMSPDLKVQKRLPRNRDNEQIICLT